MTKSSVHFPQILIANRLNDGRVVWLSETGNWTGPSTPPLTLQDSPSLQKALARAHQEETNNNIIGPVAVAVSDDLEPLLPKYKIILSGPTVRSDLGYQAEKFAETQSVSL